MFTAKNLKRPLWTAAGSMVSGVRQYGAPVSHEWNVRSLSATVGMMMYGPEYTDYRRCITTNAEVENLKRLDRVWLDTTPPVTTDPLAGNADFYVFGVNQGAGGVAEVLLKRLSHDG